MRQFWSAWSRGFFLVALIATLWGCGASQRTVWDGPPSSEAEAAYREALEDYEEGKLIEATKSFNKLRLKYPFSSVWTTLAELRLADILFEQQHYPVAASSYQEFINGHPTHEEVPYSYFQIGVCYYKQMPGDFFIMPAPWQRELNSAKMAKSSLSRFVRLYPQHEKSEEAEEMLLEVSTRLAQHELYVAEFYFKREAWKGVENRLLTLAREYPDAAVADQGLFLLAHTYIKQGNVESAAGALRLLVEGYPESDLLAEARAWLAQHDLLDIPALVI